MSWSVFTVALHACPADVLEWVREFAPTAIPDELPPPRPLPTVEQVIVGLRNAGCHWDSWYQIADGDHVIPPSGRDLYLGEMSIKVEGADNGAPLRLDDRVVGLSFRKPGEGLRRAVLVLVALGGHQLVFDISGEGVVVGPEDRADTLAESWLW